MTEQTKAIEIWHEALAHYQASGFPEHAAAVIARHLPQPSGEGPSKLAEIALRNLPYYLKHADFKSQADRTAALNCFEVIEADNASLRADRDRLAGATEQSLQGWENIVELNIIPVRYMDGAIKLAKVCRTALQHKDMTDD